jgi:hypothetical protein
MRDEESRAFTAFFHNAPDRGPTDGHQTVFLAEIITPVKKKILELEEYVFCDFYFKSGTCVI